LTEDDWLTCATPEPMLRFLEWKVSGRKLRLPPAERAHATPGTRRVAHLLVDERSRECVAMSERYAEGLANREEMKAARRAAWEAVSAEAIVSDALINAARAAARTAERWGAEAARMAVHEAAWALLNEAGETGPEPPVEQGVWSARAGAVVFEGQRWRCELLRDIAGNPFRPVAASPAWLAWDGGKLRRLAAGLYEDRQFGGLPVLADALEDAGCTDADLLDHCRSGGPHARGCWALDLLLGKG
jgi:hypothetical protein